MRSGLENKLLGVWDYNKAPTSLGFLLTFLEELLLQQEIYKTGQIDIAFIQNKQPLDHVHLSMLTRFLPQLGSLFFFNSQKFFDEFLEWRKEQYQVWPSKTPIHHTSYAGSTLLIQQHFKTLGRLIPLMSSPLQNELTFNWLQQNMPKKLPIVVHLKNNKAELKSNANPESWLKFFDTCYKQHPEVCFLLIGNDPIEYSYQKCPNVLITQYLGGNLALDLSLIINSFMFMGMSSGPCNMALYCNTPYLIWKHPNHHAKEMEQEFQGQPQFIFAKKYQKFMLTWDTPEKIFIEFDQLFPQLDQHLWIKKASGKSSYA